ncbi:MAG: 4Fe-4S dicluster domain-containing protein, partial [bacterium]|nr:4Fe-4S dicluster domain-containing protein [bacterium]
MSSSATGAKYEIRIDGRPIEVETGMSVLRAALEAGIYIPHLCYHPELPPSRSAEPVDEIFRDGEKVANDPAGSNGFEGCGLCVVRVEGVPEPQPACDLPVFDGLAVHTEGPDLKQFRQRKLAAILAHHPHACITCAQKEGCSREPCSSNVAPAERCCPLLGRCELEKVASYVGVPADTPRYVPRGLAAPEDSLIAWEPELCVGCLRCVRACAELKGVGAMGFVRRGDEVIVGLVGADRKAAGCRWCGACVEVCPTGALTDRGVSVVERESRLVPCRSGCPAGVDVPRFLRAVADGRTDDAARVMLDRLPLPHALGRVCYHPCERTCR